MLIPLHGWALRCAIALCLLVTGAVAGAQSLAPVPALTARVTDQTGTLSSAGQAALEARLEDFEAQTGSQIAVLLVPTTAPEAIEQFSIRVVDQWRLGRQGVDDGVLLLVAKNDRRLRIEVGRGLEGAIPDAYAKRIISDTITPLFKQGRFAEGIDAGVDALMALIRGEALPTPSKTGTTTGDVDFGGLLATTFIFSLFVGPILRAIFGRAGGSGVAALVGGGYWYVATAVFGMAGLGAVVAALAVLFLGGRSGGGPWITGSGHGGGFGGGGGWSGGGGFSGGGGGFSGGGASGGW